MTRRPESCSYTHLDHARVGLELLGELNLGRRPRHLDAERLLPGVEGADVLCSMPGVERHRQRRGAAGLKTRICQNRRKHQSACEKRGQVEKNSRAHRTARFLGGTELRNARKVVKPDVGVIVRERDPSQRPQCGRAAAAGSGSGTRSQFRRHRRWHAASSTRAGRRRLRQEAGEAGEAGRSGRVMGG